MITHEEAQIRTQKRRDELGNDEMLRREQIIDYAQAICWLLVQHPNIQQVESLLKQAEELRNQLQIWTWGDYKEKVPE